MRGRLLELASDWAAQERALEKGWGLWLVPLWVRSKVLGLSELVVLASLPVMSRVWPLGLA